MGVALRPAPLLLLLWVLAAPRYAAAAAVPFMGLEVDGKTVAFVCDGSRWTENKDDELAAELTAAVEAMAPDRQFAVIFFADGAASGPHDGRPLAATKENKAALRAWLADVTFGRQSTPAAGLARAFEGKPDAVVFVSSGEFDDYDAVAARVDALNPDRRVRVHTVGFFRSEKEDDSRAFVRMMEQLAQRHGGRFRAAYADEMKRAR